MGDIRYVQAEDFSTGNICCNHILTADENSKRTHLVVHGFGSRFEGEL